MRIPNIDLSALAVQRRALGLVLIASGLLASPSGTSTQTGGPKSFMLGAGR